MTTLLQLKMRKAELMNEMQAINEAGLHASDETLKEYQAVVDQLQKAEMKLFGKSKPNRRPQSGRQ